jgi:hypothetical protein
MSTFSILFFLWPIPKRIERALMKHPSSSLSKEEGNYEAKDELNDHRNHFPILLYFLAFNHFIGTGHWEEQSLT